MVFNPKTDSREGIGAMNSVTPDKRARSLTKTNLLVAILLTVFLLLVIFASSGVRGSDQFWYLAEVESILHGQGVQTNNIFPPAAYNDKPNLPLPFIQNSPIVYIPLLLGFFVGAYKGWILTNLIFAILTALLIYKIVKKYTVPKIALSTAIVYLLLPLTFWQTTQVLVEVIIAFFVVLLIYIYTNFEEDSILKYFLLTIVSIFLMLSKMNFLPVLVLIAILYVFHNGISKKTITIGISFVILGCLAYGLLNPLFPNQSSSFHNQQPALNIINVGVPGKSTNMDSYFNIKPGVISKSQLVENLMIKAKYNLKQQFISRDKAGLIFYLPFNIMIIFLFYLFYIYKKKKDKKLLYIAFIGAFFLALHLATIIIFQNQFRYMLMVLPVLTVVSGVALGEWVKSKSINLNSLLSNLVFIVVLMLLLATNTSLAIHLRSEGLNDGIKREQLVQFADEMIPVQDTLIVENCDSYLMIGYVLNPRYVLWVTNTYDNEDYIKLANNVNARWLLCEYDSVIIEKMNLENNLQQDLPEPYSKLVLISLGDRSENQY